MASYGANKNYNSGNSYGGGNSNGGTYGDNSSYGSKNASQSSQSSYSQNATNNGGGYNSASRPDQYGQQQQYGQNNNNEPGYGGNRYGANQNGGNMSGGNKSNNSQKYGSSQNQYGQYGGQQQQQYNDNGGYGDQNQPQQGQKAGDVNRVVQEIRDTRQESLNLTRNARRALQDAEESSGRIMTQLNEQSGKLGCIEDNIDSGQIHADNAREKVSELKTVNTSMFAIHIKNPLNSTKRREKEFEEAKRKAAEELAQREAIRSEEYRSKQRLDEAMGKGAYARTQSVNNGNSNNGRGGPGGRTIYDFENTAEDDAIEDEIDRDLDELSGHLTRLKTSALAINQEVARQNERVTNIASKTQTLHETVGHNTALLQKIAKRG
ncbi:Protein transport protein S9 plasma membrane t-SNARE [Linnemannia zychae]|nr:Protein transport protein S9 plasma membrane t-SNARE [Linnemannia zychae]